MHIPVLSALAAKKRWHGGAPKLKTHASLVQAQRDAPYWVKELRAGNMPAFNVHAGRMMATNEAYYLERFHELSLIHNENFWNALVNHLGPQNISFWVPVLSSAIESGNVHALSALNTRSGYPLQTLFFEWSTFAQALKRPAPAHPRALEWFSKDTSLHVLIRDISANTLQRDYVHCMLTDQKMLLWDAIHQTTGAASITHLTKAWCALPSSLRTTKSAVENAVAMLVCLNKRDKDRYHRDNNHAYRNSHESKDIAEALEKSAEIICEHDNLPMELIRTLAGRMTDEDLTNRILCAVVQYQDPHIEDDWFCKQQCRAPLNSAQYTQVVHNAARAGPLLALLDMQCEKGETWSIYSVVEPFIHQRPVQNIELPEGFLDASIFTPN